jgi:hypothetical protein
MFSKTNGPFKLLNARGNDYRSQPHTAEVDRRLA